MKEYYDGKKKEIEMESLQIGDEEIEMESLQIGDEEIEMESLQIGDMDNFAALKYDFTEDQVRYIFSYPDNQENNGSNYKEQIIEALIDAGIISAGDLSENPYESRVSFITDSGATAYHCSTLTTQLKPSLRPYLVCDIGGKIFGISTIIAKELPETGDVSSFIDQSGVGYGNLELDRKMRQFLVSGITSTEKDDQEALEKIRDIVFEYYNEEIKVIFLSNSSL
jgi:hypothetical protein